MTSAPQGTVAVSRRGFLSVLATGSLVLAARLHGGAAIARVADDTAGDLPFEPDLFVAIAPDGLVTIVAHRSEMGTGIRTALPMVVADELGADWDRVVIEQAIGDERYGSQNTDGSRSVRRFYRRMRVAGATARTMLERAAAARWNVDAGECTGRDHQVVHVPTGRSIPYGDLVADARTLDVPEESTLRFKDKSERRYVGTNVPITDLGELVTGAAAFGADVRRDGQVFAVVARPPVLGSAPVSVDADAARAIPGVVDIVEIPPFKGAPAFQPVGGVAVVATSTRAALEGRRALGVEWSQSEHAAFDSEAFETELVETARRPGAVVRSDGDAAAALADAPADAIVEADYYIPMLAHASMEPPCAVAEVTKDASGTAVGCVAWAPTQNPQAAQAQVAATLGVSPERVIINVTLLGGGFGRKSKPDFVAEAAYLASVLDRPVQVMWTREDDIRHDYFHTVAAVHMQAALGADGMPGAWLQRSAFPTITSTFDPAARNGSPLELGLGFTDVPYDVPNLQVENGPAQAHVRIGWLRFVAHIYHAFAVCSFPDELAHRAGRDPYEYLMALLGPPRQIALDGVEYPNHDEPLDRYPIDVGRLRHVTERVATLAGWGRALPRGRGLGIACHRSFLSYCAQVVEVEVSPRGEVSIPHVWVVLDCGTIVHPDRVRAQMEGGVVFAASLAMQGEITARGGVVEQSNFHDYPVARMFDVPRTIDVELVESEALPAGVGEVAVPPFAPALCNAVFAATGKRVRRLPLVRHDLAWG